MSPECHYTPDIRILFCDMTRGLDNGRLWNFEIVPSPFWRFYWAPFRHFRVLFNGREWAPGPEEFMLIPPGTAFGARCAVPLRQFNIHFTARAPFDSPESGIFVFPVSEDIRAGIGEAVSIIDSGEPSDLRLSMIVSGLCHRGLQGVPAEKLKRVPADKRILAAAAMIERGAETRLTTPALAAAAGMSVNAFIRLFREQTGETPQKLSLRKRVDRICLLLESPELTIDEIADRTGFSGRNHLTRVFKEFLGTGPSAYRKKLALLRGG